MPALLCAAGAGAFEVAAAHHLRTVTRKSLAGRAKLGLDVSDVVAPGGLILHARVSLFADEVTQGHAPCTCDGLAALALRIAPAAITLSLRVKRDG